MKFKQLLLTSTAVLMLGTPVAPLFAQSADGRFDVAQAAPPALGAAISAYEDAQAALSDAQSSGGDVAAAQANLDAAEAELSALCGAIGQPDIQACIEMFGAGGADAAATVEEPSTQEAPAEEPAAPEAPAEEPVAQEPAQPEQPAAEAPAPAPAEEAAPVDEPAQEPVAEPAEETAPEAPAEPVAQEPQPEPVHETAAPAEAQEPAQPTVEEPAAPEAPAEPQAAPEAETQSQEAAPADTNAPQSLINAVSAYETAVADFEAAIANDGDIEATAQAVMDAEAELQGLCEALGQTDLESCLTGFGFDVEIIDVQARMDQAMSGETAAPAETDDEAAAPEAPAEQMDDDVVLEGDVQGEIVPEGTDESTIAPLLDSEKDARNGMTEAAAEAGEADADADAEAGADAEAEADVDAEATADAQPQQAEPVDIDSIPSITAEEGTDRQEVSIQDIESAEQQSSTVTNNTTITNNTTVNNNTTTNNNGGQQPAGQAQAQGGVLVGPVREGPSNAEIIATIGLATVFAIGANQFINTPDTPRIVYEDDRQYYTENLSDGRTRETIVRADGTQIVTIRDRYGDVIRRSRIEPDGREILLVYVDPSYRRYDDQGRWIDPGSQLPPLRLNIPPREYVLDASAANEQQVASFLDQPPVETLQRHYTIDEVQRSSRLRDMVRRLEIGDLTFDTGSANISQSEVNTLSAVAYAMLDLIEQNPAETFLIEGHTDAVGSDLNNLELSDRRAQSVAYALTRVYGVPAENLATQGYGERYLKVNTEAAERANRRVTIRRITPLVTPMTGNAG